MCKGNSILFPTCGARSESGEVCELAPGHIARGRWQHESKRDGQTIAWTDDQVRDVIDVRPGACDREPTPAAFQEALVDLLERIQRRREANEGRGPSPESWIGNPAPAPAEGLEVALEEIVMLRQRVESLEARLVLGGLGIIG